MLICKLESNLCLLSLQVESVTEEVGVRLRSHTSYSKSEAQKENAKEGLKFREKNITLIKWSIYLIDIINTLRQKIEGI